MIINDIRKHLSELKDEKYRQFQGGLIPTVNMDNIIGVRTPDLKKYAKELSCNIDITFFLADLPHKYFEEDQLHAFIISDIKDFHKCMDELECFLPYVNNWATCDQMSPKIFKKHHDKLIIYINKWITSDKTYTVRFAICMLMKHFLDEDFDPVFPRMIADIISEEYYVNMMRAWYFATALSKRYAEIISFIEQDCLDLWTHNKTIQKATESLRITDTQKEYLRSLKKS